MTHDQDEALSLADRIVVMRSGEVRQVGTPEELYTRPATLDVAEFMGYRNLLTGTMAGTGAGGFANVSVNGTNCQGTPVGPLGTGPVTLALRPEDLTTMPDGPFQARVEQVEYRGRAFFGLASTAGGAELHFLSRDRITPGETVRLGADPDRILIYAGAK